MFTHALTTKMNSTTNIMKKNTITQQWSNLLKPVTIFLRGEKAGLPCNPNGVSPFMHTAYSCIPSALFTGWGLTLCTLFRLSPKGKTVCIVSSPRRVECPSAKRSTKGNTFSPHPILSLFHHLLLSTTDTNQTLRGVSHG